MSRRWLAVVLAWVLVAGTLLAGCRSAPPAGQPAGSGEAEEAAQCQKNMDLIAWAIEQYRQTHDGDCPVMLSDLTPSRLEMVPVCPSLHLSGAAAGQLQYQYNYRVIPLKDMPNRKQGFEIRCYHRFIDNGHDRYHGFALSSNAGPDLKEDNERWRDNPPPQR